MRNYCITICNYLNNLKGYIEEYEIKNMLWCVFGLEDIKTISNDYIIRLSSDIRYDNGKDFYNDLYDLYKELTK